MEIVGTSNEQPIISSSAQQFSGVELNRLCSVESRRSGSWRRELFMSGVCWWMFGQVFEGFFDELWDWWWLREMISGWLETVFVSDVWDGDVLAFGRCVWEGSLSFLLIRRKIQLEESKQSSRVSSTYDGFLLRSGILQDARFLGLDSLRRLVGILVWIWVNDWVEANDCVF